MVHHVIGAEFRIGNPVAIQIETGMIRPVIAAPVMTPFNVTGANIFDLRAIADERISGQRIAFRPGGEMDADIAPLKAVAHDHVAMGVIDEGAFLMAAATDQVAADIGIIGEIQHQPVATVTQGHVIRDLCAVREHHGIAKVVADRDIARNLAQVRIHEMHGKAQIAHDVVAEDIVARGIGENPVAAKSDVIAFDNRTGRVPDIDAVAAVIHPRILPANDRVAAHDGLCRAKDMHADQIFDHHIIFDQRAGGGAVQLDRCIHNRMGIAGPDQCQPAHHHIRAGHADHICHALPVNRGLVAPVQRDGALKGHRAIMAARCKDKHIAGVCPGDGCDQRPRLCGHNVLPRPGKNRDKGRKQRRKKETQVTHIRRPSVRRTCVRAFPYAAHGRTTGSNTSRHPVSLPRRWPMPSGLG